MKHINVKYISLILLFVSAIFSVEAIGQTSTVSQMAQMAGVPVSSQQSAAANPEGESEGQGVVGKSSHLFSVSHDDAGIGMHAERAKDRVAAIQRVANAISPSLGSALEKSFLGFKIVSLIGAGITIGAAWILQTFIMVVVFGIASKIFTSVRAIVLGDLFELLKRPIRITIMFVGFNVASFMLIESPELTTFVGRAFWCAYYILMFWGLGIISDFFFDRLLRQVASKYNAAVNLCEVGRKLFRIMLVFFAILVILDLFGANISAVVASLGIGGAALAFASKDTIANFFGSVSLVVDRPFAIGDWIVAGNVEGVVESIGMRSTRIRTFPKTVVTIPNSVLANESVNNMSKMPLRREKFNFGVTYSATPEQMESLVKDVSGVLDKNEFIDSKSVIVNFVGFGDSSLDVMVIYYTQCTDAVGFYKVRQKVNLDIMKVVYNMGLSFAFPSRSLYVESVPAQMQRADYNDSKFEK